MKGIAIGVDIGGSRTKLAAVDRSRRVIYSISNGMDLLALASPIRYMIAGTVQLLSVTIGAIARRRSHPRARIHRAAR